MRLLPTPPQTIAGLLCVLSLWYTAEPLNAQHIGSMANQRTPIFSQLPAGADADDVNLTPLTLTAEVLTRAEDWASNAMISPGVLATGYSQLWGKTCPGGADSCEEEQKVQGDFRGSLNLDFHLQAPSAPEDEAQALNRLLTSGGVGNLRLALNAGFIDPEDNSWGATLALGGELAWENDKQLAADVAVPSFAYGSFQLTGQFWKDFVYVGIQVSANGIIGDSESSMVASELDGSTRIRGMAGVRLAEDLYVQVKGLLPSGEDQTKQHFEIRLVTTFNPIG